MPRPYSFATNKEKRENTIRKFMQIVNEELIKKGKKPYDIDKIVESSNDPKKIEEYNKANDVMEKEKRQHDYAEKLLKDQGKNVGKNGRTFHFKIEVPEENDPNKEEKERHNQEIVDKYSDPNQAIDIVKEEFDRVFHADPSLFYPNDLDEAIKTFEKHGDLLNSCHVINSTITNNFVISSCEVDSFYKYYLSTIEDGENVHKFIERKASPLSFFLPDDLELEDLGEIIYARPEALNKTFNDNFPEMNFDIGKNSAEFLNYLQDKEIVEKLSTFFKTHNKDFILKNRLSKNIEGKDFKSQIKNLASNEIDQYIDKGFEGAKLIKVNSVTSKLSVPYRQAYIEAITLSNQYKQGKLKVSEVLEYLNEKKTKSKSLTKDKSAQFIHDLYFLHAAFNRESNDDLNIRNNIEEMLEEMNAPISRAKFYGLIFDGKVSVDAITSINDEGFEVYDKASDLYKSKVQIQNLKIKSIGNLRKQFDKGDIKNNVKQNPTKFMSFAKAINEKYNSRSGFWKVVSPFAWREKWLIQDINKYASSIGINQKEFDNYISSDTSDWKNYNGFFTRCNESIKNINVINEHEPVDKKENIVVDYFDKEQVKEDYKSFENAEVVIKKDVEQNIENEEIKEEEDKKFVVVDYDVNNNDVGQIVNEEQENVASNDENIL